MSNFSDKDKHKEKVKRGPATQQELDTWSNLKAQDLIRLQIYKNFINPGSANSIQKFNASQEVLEDKMALDYAISSAPEFVAVAFDSAMRLRILIQKIREWASVFNSRIKRGE